MDVALVNKTYIWVFKPVLPQNYNKKNNLFKYVSVVEDPESILLGGGGGLEKDTPGLMYLTAFSNIIKTGHFEIILNFTV